MIRVWTMSDLHLELGEAPCFDAVPEHDVVVLAGNVSGSLVRTVEWAHETFDRPVVVVAGNREFWNADRMAALSEGRDAADRTAGHVTLLENEATVVEEVVFLGATLWTDYRLYGDDNLAWVKEHCGAVLDDHKWIRSDGFNSRRWEPSDAIRTHEASLAWLRRAAVTYRGRPQVVITHHAPHPKSVHRNWAKDFCGASLASDLERHIVEMAPLAWIHGHSLDRCDYRVGGTRIVSQPVSHRRIHTLGRTRDVEPLPPCVLHVDVTGTSAAAAA